MIAWLDEIGAAMAAAFSKKAAAPVSTTTTFPGATTTSAWVGGYGSIVSVASAFNHSANSPHFRNQKRDGSGGNLTPQKVNSFFDPPIVQPALLYLKNRLEIMGRFFFY